MTKTVMTREEAIKNYSDRLEAVRKELATTTDEYDVEMLKIEMDQLMTFIMKLESAC